MGNSRARAVYEAQLPDGFRRPQTDAALESFIRAKYEQKKYVAKEWVPSPPPKVIKVCSQRGWGVVQSMFVFRNLLYGGDSSPALC